MRTGSIYAYNYPGAGRDVYVGSTQDGNMLRQHCEHMKAKTSLGNWLRWFPENEIPMPREVMRIKYEVKETLYWWERHFQEVLGTMRAQGGLNKIPAWPTGLSQENMAKLGAASLTREQRSYAGRRGGRSAVGNLSRVEHLTQIAKLGGKPGEEKSETHRRALSKAARNKLGGGWGNCPRSLGPHIRWHILRGIIKSTCRFCAAIVGGKEVATSNG